MGQVARHIDQYDDEARDIIITAQHWGPGWVDEPDESGGSVCRCLVGHERQLQQNELNGFILPNGTPWEPDQYTHRIGYRVLKLMQRFGIPRMVALFKMRASKGHNIVATSPHTQGRMLTQPIT